MRLTLFILSVLLLSFPAFAQEECKLTLAEAPALLNLRLGMTAPEVNAAIGRDLKVKVKPKGERSFFKNYIKKPAKGALTGVRAIYLRFFNGSLYQIELFYQEDYLWPDLGSLLTDYSSSHSFSANYWRVKNGYANARCDGFSLDADHVLGAHIELTDDVVLAEVEESRKKN
jgi:hypothetical protein